MAALKYSTADHFHTTVTCVSHLSNTVKNIKVGLTPTQLAMLRETFIGRLIDVEFKFSGPLIHLVLLREVEQENEQEMSFLLGGRVRTFTKDDFARITGLPRGKPFIRRDHSIRLRELLFRGRYGVNKFDLDEKILDHELTDDKDVVRMALVYFVELVFIGGLRRKQIDTSFYSLVEEEEMWESFDWVDTIYGITLSSLKEAIEGKLKPTEENKEEEVIEDAMVEDEKAKKPDAKAGGATYSLAGFPYAFQAWIFEQIPELVAEKYISRVETDLPPVCSWRIGKTMTQAALKKNIFAQLDKIPDDRIEEDEKLLLSDLENNRRHKFEALLKLQKDKSGLIEPKNIAIVPGVFLPQSSVTGSSVQESVDHQRSDSVEAHSSVSSNGPASNRHINTGIRRHRGRNSRQPVRQWIRKEKSTAE